MRGKKRSRNEPGDPNPRPTKKQEVEEPLDPEELEFKQIEDECVKKLTSRARDRLLANLDVLLKIQQQAKEKNLAFEKSNNINNINNNNEIKHEETNSCESAPANEKGSKPKGRPRTKITKATLKPNEIEVRYANKKAVILRPQIHIMPSVDATPSATTWTPIRKNYPVHDDRERKYIPYFSDEQDHAIAKDPDQLYDKQNFAFDDHQNDVILESYIQKYGLKDTEQILPEKQLEYLSDVLDVTVVALKKYLLEKTNYIELYCPHSGKFDLKEFSQNLEEFFCRRCATTFCQYHIFDAPYQHFNQNKKNAVITDKIDKPCGEHCFASDKNSHTNNNARSTNTEWTRREVLLLDKAKNAFSTSCQIHQIIQTKTCRQIFDRIKELGLLNKDDNQEESSESELKMKPKLTNLNRKRKGGLFDTVYTPCSHPGQPCGDNPACPCFRNNTYCEKYCACSEHCERKFPGCQCTLAKDHCKKKSNCLCVLELRECDPDICRCQCDCYNAVALMEKQKQLSVRKSKVAGWGLFADTKIKAGEFIAEYKGELITADESERRGRIYDERKVNFLFGLQDSCYVVDATRKGNKMKFANHSKNPNCNSTLESTLGELRIIIRANKDIEADEELFIDYGYTKDYFTRPGSQTDEEQKNNKRLGKKKTSLKLANTEEDKNNPANMQTKKKKAVYSDQSETSNKNDEQKSDDEQKNENEPLPVIRVPPRARVFDKKSHVKANSIPDSHVADSSVKQKDAPDVNGKIQNTNKTTSNNNTLSAQVSDGRNRIDNNKENIARIERKEELQNKATSATETQSKKPAVEPKQSQESNTSSINTNNNNTNEKKNSNEERKRHPDPDRKQVQASNNSNEYSNANDDDDLVLEDIERSHLQVKQRKITGPKLSRRPPVVVDLDAEHVNNNNNNNNNRRSLAKSSSVQCISSGEEETVFEPVDVDDQEVEYLGKYVDVQSIDSDD